MNETEGRYQELNEKRLIAMAVIDDLYKNKSVFQLQLLKLQVDRCIEEIYKEPEQQEKGK